VSASTAKRQGALSRPGLDTASPRLFVCEGLLGNGSEGARHVVIDPHQRTRFKDVGSQLLQDAGVADMIERHDAPSEIVLPRFVEERRTFDLAFVDGDHRFDGVFVDLFYLGRLVRPGGCIFLDDYQLPAIARATSFWATNLGWALEEVSAPDEHHQWAVVRTPQEPDTRSFHHFVEF
jgi:predicted O-methyltransferase YrrM